MFRKQVIPAECGLKSYAPKYVKITAEINQAKEQVYPH